MPITIKIDVTKIDKGRLFEAKSGAKYLDLVAFANRNGAGQYGDTHFICQSCTKEERENGLKMPIIGNMKIVEQADRDRRPVQAPVQAPVKQQTAFDDSEVPF